MRPRRRHGDYLLCDRGFVPTITVVVDRETQRRASAMTTNLRPAEDTDFAMRLFLADTVFRCWKNQARCGEIIFDPGRVSAGRGDGELASWLEQHEAA